MRPFFFFRRAEYAPVSQSRKFGMLATIAFLCIAVAMFSGCATFEEPEEHFQWFRARPPAAEPYEVLHMDPINVAGFCQGARACTMHRAKVIVLAHNAPSWHLKHERRHEAGEDHL